jgi:hypothetical protein
MWYGITSIYKLAILTISCRLMWRRGSLSIPIERQSIFDHPRPKSTVWATAGNGISASTKARQAQWRVIDNSAI